MNIIEKHIKNNGKAMDLIRVTDPIFNDSTGGFDEDNSTIETVTIKGVPSELNEEELKRVEGRGAQGGMKLRIPYDTDIKATREGRADRVKYDIDGDGSKELFKVENVRISKRAPANKEIKTKKAILSRLTGR